MSIGRRLRAASEAGAFERLADLYAEDAVLDWSMPGSRAHATGPEAIVAQLSEWWRGRGDLTRWDESELRSLSHNRAGHFCDSPMGTRPQGATASESDQHVVRSTRA
jgi:hypothetical protein